MTHNRVVSLFSDLEKLVCCQVKDVTAITSVLSNINSCMCSTCICSTCMCGKTFLLLNNDVWEPLIKLAKDCSQILLKNDPDDNEINLLMGLLRFLRNTCSVSNSYQTFILRQEHLYDFSKQTLKCFLQKESPKESLVLKICIQLFGNLLVRNEDTKPLIWSLFFKEHIFGLLFAHKDVSVQECTMMVLFNCMSDETNHCIINTKEGTELVVSLMNALVSNQNDWGLLFMGSLLKQEDFFNCYQVLPLSNRLIILNIVEEMCKGSLETGHYTMPSSLLGRIEQLFLKQVSQLLNNISEIEPAEIVSMLSILCLASLSSYIDYLYRNPNLLSSCVECLKYIHLQGKNEGNVFSSLSETKHMTSQFSEEISGHPFYGFKKNLIRLIGNLCCNFRVNQDLVRNLDGIPLVLDCCKFDAKNPYITQWCILAIKNIMENNTENQAILAGITMSGEIADTRCFQEIGFDVQNKNGKFCFVPISKP